MKYPYTSQSEQIQRISGGHAVNNDLNLPYVRGRYDYKAAR